MTQANGVFEGGGVKGIGLVGALQRAEEYGVEFVAVGGTSAGSIVAALYAAGYTAAEMKTILMELDFTSLLDPAWPKSLALFRRFGFFKGRRIYTWMRGLLAQKGVVTFQDVAKDLRIVASDLTNKRILQFNRTTHPTLEVARAVRMSISIPLFFFAYPFGERLVVDGGVLSNYPLWLFEGSARPTLGFKLVSDQETTPPAPPRTFFSYLGALVATMMEAHDRENESEEGWGRTIHIPTGAIPSTKFNLSDAEKTQLYEAGYAAASEQLEARGGLLLAPAPR